METETIIQATPDEVAAQILEVVPQVMRTIRTRMRQYRGSELSVPEFRAMGFINRHTGTSLTELADHIGLTLSSISKLIDRLVENRWVSREPDPEDRRRMTLALTARGRTLLDAAQAATQTSLAEQVAALSPAEAEMVIQTMQVLRPIFSSEREKEFMLAREHNGNS